MKWNILIIKGDAESPEEYCNARFGKFAYGRDRFYSIGIGLYYQNMKLKLILNFTNIEESIIVFDFIQIELCNYIKISCSIHRDLSKFSIFFFFKYQNNA